LSILFIFLYIFLEIVKQSQFNPYPENVENINEPLIMPENGRWDLIRRLKVKSNLLVNNKLLKDMNRRYCVLICNSTALIRWK